VAQRNAALSLRWCCVSLHICVYSDALHICVHHANLVRSCPELHVLMVQAALTTKVNSPGRR